MTWRMSLVRWYSIVAFQWRSVLKLMRLVLGFLAQILKPESTFLELLHERRNA
jgi:hypothetical protein